MAKKQSPSRGINGKPWYWWVTQYECGPMPTARRRGRWYLYRCFGAGGDLLYVGFTNDLASRFGWHRKHSPWHQLAVRVVVVEFLDETSARYAEIQTIQMELPAHNLRKQVRFTDGWEEMTPEQFVARPQRARDS